MTALEGLAELQPTTRVSQGEALLSEHIPLNTNVAPSAVFGDAVLDPLSVAALAGRAGLRLPGLSCIRW